MGRTTKQLSGGGKDKFLRALIEAQADIGKVPTDELVARLGAAITDIRVKREAWEEVTLAKPELRNKGLKHATPRTHTLKADPRRPAGKSDGAAAGAAAAPAVTTPAAATPEAPGFDPFAFSALAVLTKGGAAALADKLVTITSAEDLVALAAAQHLSIDRTLSDVVALRAAVVTATEARLQERRAAAS